MTPRFRNGLGIAAAFLRLFPGSVLLFSGYLKAIRPPEEFAALLANYWLLPPGFLVPLARAVPWVEMWVGLCLLTGFGVRRAATAAAVLYGVFVAFLAQALLRHLPMNDCGCFGRLGPALRPAQTLVMDLVLGAACAVAAWDRESRFSLDRWIDPARTPRN
jgi:uncharacterized membrane protein YphA (DoxX/SURF4 family)